MTPDIDNEFIQTRRKHEKNNISDLQRALPNVHLHQVELKESDIHGLDLLRAMGKEFHGQIDISDGLGPFQIGLGLEINRGTCSEGDDVYLHLP